MLPARFVLSSRLVVCVPLNSYRLVFYLFSHFEIRNNTFSCIFQLFINLTIYAMYTLFHLNRNKTITILCRWMNDWMIDLNFYQRHSFFSKANLANHSNLISLVSGLNQRNWLHTVKVWRIYTIQIKRICGL